MKKLAALTLLLVSPALHAGLIVKPTSNLLANPTFEKNVAGWNVGRPDGGTGFAAAFSATDAEGRVGSGSAKLTSTTGSGGVGGGLWVCLTVTGSKSYTLSGKAFVPSGQATTGYAELALYYYASPQCAGSAIDHASTNVVSTLAGATDGWTPMHAVVTTPATAVSAVFYANVVKYEAGGSFQLSVDDLFAGPSQVERLVVPASASIHGNAGAFFHSDLWAMNRSFTNSLPVTATYHCFKGMSCAGGPKTLTLAPRQAVYQSDVVSSLFGAPETAGAIELAYDPGLGLLSATSRVYTPSLPAPTFGSAIPAFLATEARTAALFPGLGAHAGTTTGGFRSNVGAYNPGEETANVTFVVHGPDGAALGHPVTLALEPHTPGQINDVFGAAGAGSVVTDNASLAATSDVPVFFNVTVIDNLSGDSVYAALSDDPPPDTGAQAAQVAPATITIPASASRHGIANSFFHSDVWMVNRSFTAPLGVVATFRCFSGLSCGSGPKLLLVAPRASLLLADAVGTTFGAPESAGAIELTYDSGVGQLAATSRVYTPSQPSPTFGAAIPALERGAAKTRALFLGAGSNGGDTSKGFRTNVGAYNPNDVAVTATFRVADANGAPLGHELTLTLAPHEPNQINDVFGAAGAGSTVTVNAQILTTATLPVFFNVTVIDNQSGDSVYAVAGADDDPPRVFTRPISTP